MLQHLELADRAAELLACLEVLERALAQRMVSADRNQFKPNAGTKSRLTGAGSRAKSWMPTNTMAHVFSQPSVHWHGNERVVSVSPGPSMELSQSLR